MRFETMLGRFAVTDDTVPVPPSPAGDADAKRQRAERRVAAIKGFYIHLVVFVAVIAGLLLINAASKNQGWWVHWVFLGWGLGVLAHGLAVMERTSKAVADWEARKVREIMAKDR